MFAATTTPCFASLSEDGRVSPAVQHYVLSSQIASIGAAVKRADRAKFLDTSHPLGRAVGGLGPIVVSAVAASWGFDTAIALLALLYITDILVFWLLIPDRRGAELT